MTHTLLPLASFGQLPGTGSIYFLGIIVATIVIFIVLIGVYFDVYRKLPSDTDHERFRFDIAEATASAPTHGPRKLSFDKANEMNRFYTKRQSSLGDYFGRSDAARVARKNAFGAGVLVLALIGVIVGACFGAGAVADTHNAERTAWNSAVSEWAKKTYGVTAGAGSFTDNDPTYLDGFIATLDGRDAPLESAGYDGVVIADIGNGRSAIDVTLSWVSGIPVLRERNTPNAGTELERVTR